MHFNKTFAARILAGLMIASTMAVPAMAVSGTVNSGNTTLNLREGANTESKVLADLQNGSKVEVLATAENLSLIHICRSTPPSPAPARQ